MNTSCLSIISAFLYMAALVGCLAGSHSQGERLYEAHCANCHMSDGTGLAALIPPLTDPEYLNQNRDQIACTIRFGVEGPLLIEGKEYTGTMEGIPALNEVQIHNIVNYIYSSWGNGLPEVAFRDVVDQLEGCGE